MSLPKEILHRIDYVVEKLRYWPSRSSFVRDACLSMLEKYLRELEPPHPYKE